jgi:hypothetical protein
MGDCGPSPPTLEVPKEESIAHGIVKRFEQLETQVSLIPPVATIIPGRVVCVFYHLLVFVNVLYVYQRHSYAYR